MRASDVTRALDAAASIASDLDLPVNDAIVLHDSNKLGVRLLPCDVFARIAHRGDEVADLEIEVARRLAETRSPVAALEPRVPPLVHERDGFAVTLWTYYEPVGSGAPSAEQYADALQRLHAGMRKLGVSAPHVSDRVAEAGELITSPDRTPALAARDREVLDTVLRSSMHAIREGGAAEQLLHGEPHPGNVLGTANGPIFVDLETCCRGPVEFDLAHVPAEVSAFYPADQRLLSLCRGLVLAMVAAWRWDRDDRLPDGRRAGRELLAAVRVGPPWPTLDVVMRGRGDP